MEEHTPAPEKGRRWGLLGAILSALVASACCIGPLLFVLIGTGGALAGTFAFLEPLRSLFVAVALGFLGYGFYRVYRKPKPRPGEITCACEDPKRVRRDKVILYISAVIIATLVALPYAVPVIAGTGSTVVAEAEGSEIVVLRMEQMTCAACTVTIRKSLEAVDGVRAVEVTIVPPRARVAYDPKLVTVEKMMKATEVVGYPSSPEGKREK